MSYTRKSVYSRDKKIGTLYASSSETSGYASIQNSDRPQKTIIQQAIDNTKNIFVSNQDETRPISFSRKK